MSGVITGRRPQGVLGDVWDAQDKQEYSFFVGGKYISFHRAFEPFGLVFGTIANYATLATKLVNHAGFWDHAFTFYAALGHSIMDLPILQGISRIFDALKSENPNKIASLAERQVEPKVPLSATVRIASRTLDPMRREIHTWTERMLSDMVPGYSERLKPVRNIVTGEPLLHEGMFGPGTESLIATHTFAESPALQEIDRLKGAGITKIKDHIYGEKPEELIEREHFKPPGVKLTDAQKDRWEVLMTQEVKIGGKNLRQRLDALVTSDQYKRQGELEKIARIQGVWHDYYLRGRDRLLRDDKDLAAKVKTVLGERRIQHMPVERQEGARERLLSTLGR